MSAEVVSALIQLGISLGGAAGIVQILLLRANRRRITGDASASEANAASTLSGAALKMVENAQAAQTRSDAVAGRLQAKFDEKVAGFDRVSDENQELRWTNYQLRARVEQLELLVTQTPNIALPPAPPPALEPSSDPPPA